MIILDTHVWIWWVNNDRARLRQSWLDLIEGTEHIGVAAISCFEVAWLSHNGRLRLPCPLLEWFPQALAEADIRLLPLSPLIATISVELPPHHGDAHDRMIIATAVEHDAKLLSADGRFPAYEELRGRLIP